MKTYTLVNDKDKQIVAVFNDRDLANKMMKVYTLNGYKLFCITMDITENLPKWAERILELDK